MSGRIELGKFASGLCLLVAACCASTVAAAETPSAANADRTAEVTALYVQSLAWTRDRLLSVAGA